MQLSMTFDEWGKKKPHNPQKEKFANRNGLGQFLDDKYIDIQKARDNGYIDELKWLLTYMISDLTKYKKYREDYREELNMCIKLFEFSYFDNKDAVNMDKFLQSIQEYFIKNSIAFDNKKKNDYIQQLFEKDINILGYIGQKIDEKQRAALIMSLYPSYISSKKQPLEERRLRYNRIFFQHQLEYKKIYCPHGRKTDTTDIREITSASLLENNS